MAYSSFRLRASEERYGGNLSTFMQVEALGRRSFSASSVSPTDAMWIVKGGWRSPKPSSGGFEQAVTNRKKSLCSSGVNERSVSQNTRTVGCSGW